MAIGSFAAAATAPAAAQTKTKRPAKEVAALRQQIEQVKADIAQKTRERLAKPREKLAKLQAQLDEFAPPLPPEALARKRRRSEAPDMLNWLTPQSHVMPTCDGSVTDEDLGSCIGNMKTSFNNVMTEVVDLIEQWTEHAPGDRIAVIQCLCDGLVECLLRLPEDDAAMPATHRFSDRNLRMIDLDRVACTVSLWHIDSRAAESWAGELWRIDPEGLANAKTQEDQHAEWWATRADERREETAGDDVMGG